jgi:cytochrome c553
MHLALARLGFLATLFALPALAADGNKDDGKIKVYTCTGCHGIANYKNAYPSYRVPKIHGQNREYLVAALNAYRSGERTHPTMRAQGESLSDQDIADIAAYLSESAAPVTQEPAADPNAIGVKRNCHTCHGVSGQKSLVESYPRLAGQHRDYLMQALSQYKNRSRNGAQATVMHGQVDALADPANPHLFDDAIEALADYYSQLPGTLEDLSHLK